MPEHRIRLNRGWEIRAAPLDFHFARGDAELLANTAVDQRWDLPLVVDVQPTDDQGQPVRLILTRWFNAPSNLAADQPLQIVVEPAALVSLFRFNGEVLLPIGDGPQRLRFEIAGKLRRHNRLDILVGDPPSLSQASVTLVIEG